MVICRYIYCVCISTSKPLDRVCFQFFQAMLQDQFVNAVTVNGGDEEVWLTAKQGAQDGRLSTSINHNKTDICIYLYIIC